MDIHKVDCPAANEYDKSDMTTLKEKIEEALDCLEVDSNPGGGGWIDSNSRNVTIDAIEQLIKKEMQAACDTIMSPFGLTIKKRSEYRKQENGKGYEYGHTIFSAGFDAGLNQAVERIKKNWK